MKKFLIITIILLFMGSAIFPSMGVNNNVKYNSKDKISILNNFKNVGTSNVNGTYFHGQSDKPIYVISISSPNHINITNITYTITLGVNGMRTISGDHFQGFIITDGTNLKYEGVGYGTGDYKPGNLRYIHFKFGKFSKTYDNRIVYNKSGFGGRHYGFRGNLHFPPGKQHFIFTGVLNELSQEEILIDTKVWINFSDTCEDLEIKTSEEGKVYGLWYGEFNANAIISKNTNFELMLKGRATFHINNTFIYRFGFQPRVHGFWRILWNTPEGNKRLNIIMYRDKRYYNEEDEEGCLHGLGESGEYKLSTSYLDFLPVLNNNTSYPHPRPVSFFGMDVKLT